MSAALLLHLDALAARCALQVRQDGGGWCPCCLRGGWDGPLLSHYQAAASLIGRMPTLAELDAFEASFLAALVHLPPVACEAHQGQKRSA